MFPTALMCQSQEHEGSDKPGRIKEAHLKLHSFQASLCTLAATHLTLIYVCLIKQLLGCLIKQTGIIIRTILNLYFVGNTGNRTRDLWLDKCISTRQLYHLIHHQNRKYDNRKLLNAFAVIVMDQLKSQMIS